MSLVDHITGNAKITPYSVEESLLSGEGFTHKNNKYSYHTKLPIHESAFFRSNNIQLIIISFLLILLGLGLVLATKITLVVLVAIITVIYFSDLLFNLFLIYRSFANDLEIKISPDELMAYDDKFWPTYTILCPLYKESSVLGQFVTAMSNLDYPKNKLQVLLLLEENDGETIDAAKNMNLPKYFEIVVVPHSQPKTKPKACNYGLKIASGEFSVIYDAEDIPEKDQLKKAYLAFKRLKEQGHKTACVQAKLNFYNPRQNLLTRVFTAEYSTWFDLMLTGMQSIQAPIPLGGTSNHFPTQVLRDIHGWDPFNVTEDCDLGMRLVKKGYQTAIVDSTTWEEANSEIVNWFWQRTRWVKGYIQTYFVHMRKPQHFLSTWRNPNLITFQLVVGGKVMSMIINPIMWLITISYFMFRQTLGPAIESLYPTPVLYMGVFSLIFGNFLYMYYYMIGCAKREQDDLIKYVFLVPIYWLAMSAAAWYSIWLFFTNPHHWSKTKHGLHLNLASIKNDLLNLNNG